MPVAAIPDFLAKAVPAVLALVPGARPVSFGHLGDGNLHFNFNSPSAGDDPGFLAQWEEVQQTVHDIVKEFDGSISAEHGIGVMKRANCRATNAMKSWTRCAPSNRLTIPRIFSIREN